MVEAGQPLDPVFLIQPMPSTDSVVVQQQNLGNRRTTHAAIEQHQRVRPPRQAMRRRPVARQCDQVSLMQIAVASRAASHVFARAGTLCPRPAFNTMPLQTAGGAG